MPISVTLAMRKGLTTAVSVQLSGWRTFISGRSDLRADGAVSGLEFLHNREWQRCDPCGLQSQGRPSAAARLHGKSSGRTVPRVALSDVTYFRVKLHFMVPCKLGMMSILKCALCCILSFFHCHRNILQS